MPTITTKRLTLTPLTEDDRSFLLQLWSKPDVMRYIGEGDLFSEDKGVDVFHIITEHQKKYGYSLQKVTSKEEGAIGYAGLIHYELNDTNTDVEVGYLFDTPFWNKGYASEIVPEIVRWGLQTLKLPCICGVTHPKNAVSQRILLKSGLEYVGKAHYLGREVDRFETPHA